MPNTLAPFVYKDSKGYVWLGGTAGLNRFDGHDVVHFKPNTILSKGLEGYNVQSHIFEDPKNDLWFSTYEALNHYCRGSEDFESFKLYDASGKAYKDGYHMVAYDMASHSIFIIINLTDKNQNLLYQYFPGTGHQILINTSSGFRSRYYTDKSKTTIITFGMNFYEGISIHVLDNINKTWTKKEINNIKDQALKVKDACLIKNKLYCTTKSGLLEYDLINSTAAYHANGISSFFNVIKLNGGQLLISSREAGLFIFDIHKKLFIQHVMPNTAVPNSLQQDRVDELYLDRDSVLWASNWKYGVQYADLAKNKFKAFAIHTDMTNSEANSIYHLLLDKEGKKIVSNEKENTYLIDSDFSIKSLSPTNYKAYCFFNDETLLAIAGKQLLKANKPYTRYDKILKLPDSIEAYHAINDGKKIWLATKKGIYYLSQLPPYALALEPKFARGYCNYLYKIENQIFVEFNFSNLLHINGSKVTTYAEIGMVNDIAKVKNENAVWVVSEKGLKKLNYDNNTVDHVSQKLNFPITSMTGVEQVSDSILYISSSRGLHSYNLYSQQHVLYNNKAGLLQDNIEMYRSDFDSKLYLVGSKSIHEMETSTFLPRKIAVSPLLTNLELNDKVHINTNTTTFNPNDNTLAFTLTAADYSDPTGARLRYMIKGLDNDWIRTAQGKIIARYPKIAHGTYKLVAYAINSEGVENPNPLVYTFTILAPWYSTLWFKLLNAVLIAALLYAIYKYRTNELLTRQKLIYEGQMAVESERKRIARDMHDDLGSGLSAIHLFTDHIKSSIQNTNPDAAADLDMVVQSSKDLNQKVKEIIWTNESREMTISSIFQFLKKTSLEQTQGSPARLVFGTIPPNCDKIISSTKNKNIFLCMKEGINNAMKYSKGKIYINTYIAAHDALITIEDEGPGFDIDKVLLGNGVKNIIARMNEIGGKAEYKKSNWGGTALHLSFNCNE